MSNELLTLPLSFFPDCPKDAFLLLVHSSQGLGMLYSGEQCRFNVDLFIWEQISNYSPQGASQSSFLLKTGRFFHPTFLPLRVLQLSIHLPAHLGYTVWVSLGRRGEKRGCESALGFSVAPSLHGPKTSLLSLEVWVSIEHGLCPQSNTSILLACLCFGLVFIFFLPLEISFWLCFEFSCKLSWCCKHLGVLSENRNLGIFIHSLIK